MKLNHVILVIKNLNIAASTCNQSNESHHQSIAHVTNILKKYNITYTFSTDIYDPHGDLIISIGGDGTFLSACHKYSRIPILGINSMPMHSVGFFCAITAENFENYLIQLKNNIVTSTMLNVLSISIQNQPKPFIAINDVLFACQRPSGLAKYAITIGELKENQRSSGIWISSAAGSYGAILSAGGQSMPINSADIQFFVREPYRFQSASYRLSNDIVSKGNTIELLPQATDIALYIDGNIDMIPLDNQEIVQIKSLPSQINVFLPSNNIKN